MILLVQLNSNQGKFHPDQDGIYLSFGINEFLKEITESIGSVYMTFHQLWTGISLPSSGRNSLMSLAAYCR